jgi:hypothetical protein
MRKLTLIQFRSLDGVVQSPWGPDEDPSDSFGHGGWSFGYRDGQMERVMGESLSKPFDLVFGCKTYANNDRRAPDARDGPRYCGAQP